MMDQELLARKKKLAVIGLGYVGLPIALRFARQMNVIGFDINASRVAQMSRGQDPSNELDSSAFEDCSIEFTADPEKLIEASFFIVAVPTPIARSNTPDLGPVLSASKTVAGALTKGDFVVYESTVYPGCTEEDCLPVLESESGLKVGDDFKIGYSPERINPGDKNHTLSNVIKITSGCDSQAAADIARVYELVVEAGVHQASSIKVAEAAKIIENTQRDVNIALINELSIIFNRMNINTYEVLEAAGTKWNFLPFRPGLVGGHCIGVDPYYLTHKAEKLGYHAQIVNSGRFVNDSMGAYVAKQTVKKMLDKGKNLRESRVLIMGATFKENVSDIRNSKVADVVREFRSYKVEVDVIDAYASPQEVKKEYGYDLSTDVTPPYDAVIVAVNHKPYLDYNEDYFKSLMDDKGVLVDLKGILRGSIKELTYWSL